MNVNYGTHNHAFMSMHSIAMGIILTKQEDMPRCSS